MVQTKNLCAQVPLDLHTQITEAREQKEEASVSPCATPDNPEEAQPQESD